MAKILVAEDEATSLAIIKKILEDAGHDVTTVPDGESALLKLKEIKYDNLLTDFNMPGMTGVQLTREALKLEPDLIVILFTAFLSVKSVVEAIKLGAFDYLTKPIDKDELLLSIQRGMERVSLVNENLLLKHKLEQVESQYDYPTESKPIKDMMKEAIKVARSDSTILITGSNGTGKEVLANFIYHNSKRKDQPFVVINCAAIPEQLLESELFGHVRGSFTGAVKDHKGYFEIADKGTIFLDEIGEINTMLQVKLLRVLQERTFSKVGDTRIQTTNVRIIAATNQDLKKRIEEGAFREDLFYRLNVFEFHLPSLNKRPEDVMFYFKRFLNEFGKQNGKKIKEIDPEVKTTLLKYNWPGNIRELKNVAERVTILCDDGIITPDLLPTSFADSDSGIEITNIDDYNENKEKIIREFEVNFITKYLKIYNGNVAATARAINFHPVSLRQKISKLGIELKQYKEY